MRSRYVSCGLHRQGCPERDGGLDHRLDWPWGIVKLDPTCVVAPDVSLPVFVSLDLLALARAAYQAGWTLFLSIHHSAGTLSQRSDREAEGCWCFSETVILD